MKKTLVKIYELFGKIYINPILKAEQKKPMFKIINERPVEYGFCFKHMQKLCKGKVLDVGPGKSSWPHILYTCGFNVTAVDKMDGYWGSYFNRHFKILHDDITQSKLTSTFQFATCLSVLEHIPDHVAAVKGMHDVIESNGYLILTFPYNETTYHPDIYKHENAGYGKDANFVTQVYSRNEINKWLENTSFKIIDQEYYKVFSGTMWTFGERISPSVLSDQHSPHHLTCLLLQKTK